MNFEYEFRVRYLLELLKNLSLKYKNLALYGGGQHTRWLLGILENQEIDINYIIDDSVTGKFGGVQVGPWDEMPPQIKAVILSSDTQEELLHASLLQKTPLIPIIRPYGDLAPGPYKTTPAKKPEILKNDIYIVTGLPRTGTSMMMRVLEAGGIEVLTDGIRAKDINNPNGYYELEAVKKIKEDTSFLKGAENKVFKIVSSLIPFLPESYNYKIIFMERELNEVIASQNKMLGDERVTAETLIPLFTKQINDVKNYLNHQTNCEVLYMNYNNILTDPVSGLSPLLKFIKGFKLSAATTTIDNKLYRNRNQNER